MGEAPGGFFAESRAGVDRMLATSLPEDEYFLEYVRESPFMRFAFTHDLSAIRLSLMAKPLGQTSLIDAIYLALQAMRNAQHANRALIIVSDGYDNSSVYRFSELARLFDEAPVPMFFVLSYPSGPNTQRFPFSLESSARESLIHFVNGSGGYVTPALGGRNAGPAIADLTAILRSPYVIQVAGQTRASLAAFRSVRIETPGLSKPPLLAYRALLSNWRP